MDDDHRKFEKELAKLNAQLTIVTTGSAVFAAVGISLLILGITLSSEAISKTGDENKILTTIGNVYLEFGVSIFVIGMIVLIMHNSEFQAKSINCSKNLTRKGCNKIITMQNSFTNYLLEYFIQF